MNLPGFAAEERVDLLDKLPPARLLTTLAGGCAILIGLLAFFLQMATGPQVGPLGTYGRSGVILMLVINATFGAFLLYGAYAMARREKEWALLIMAFATVLLVLGGIPGAVAGILGLFAGGSILVRDWRAPRGPSA